MLKHAWSRPLLAGQWITTPPTLAYEISGSATVCYYVTVSTDWSMMSIKPIDFQSNLYNSFIKNYSSLVCTNTTIPIYVIWSYIFLFLNFTNFRNACILPSLLTGPYFYRMNSIFSIYKFTLSMCGVVPSKKAKQNVKIHFFSVFPNVLNITPEVNFLGKKMLDGANEVFFRDQSMSLLMLKKYTVVGSILFCIYMSLSL